LTCSECGERFSGRDHVYRIKRHGLYEYYHLNCGLNTTEYVNKGGAILIANGLHFHNLLALQQELKPRERKLKGPPHHWTEQEKKMIIDNPEMKNKDLAGALGMSENVVLSMRAWLIKTGMMADNRRRRK
jgi:hypothetical protein